MSDDSRSILESLAPGEVRVYTLDSGDSATVRGAARSIIGVQIRVPASEIELFDTPKGKPYLRNDPGMHFSISHSRGISMIAVTRVAPVGVDVEQLRVVPNAETILRRFFTHEAIDEILSDDRRDLRFVEAWTRAEARVKARGASVWEAATIGPDTVVRQIDAPEGFAAAVAVVAQEWWVTQYSLSIADLSG